MSVGYQANTIPDGAISIDEMGSFFIGGRKVTVSGLEKQEVLFSPGGSPLSIDLNGDYWVEQMYVQYFQPKNAISRLPVLFWHGGGSTGATWETTPDGREGWRNMFLRLGWPVYCSDAVERGRSGWACASLGIWDEEPTRATYQDVHRRMRSGAATKSGGTYTGGEECQFPFDHFDEYMMGNVPRWISTDEAVLAAYLKLVERVGPCIIVATSQGASFAGRVAEAHHELVKGLVLVEPAQSGSGERLPEGFRVPLLSLFGDFIDTDPRWVQNRESCLRYVEAIKARGGVASLVDLPKIGMPGNTHLMPVEKNNADVAILIHRWLSETVLEGDMIP